MAGLSSFGGGGGLSASASASSASGPATGGDIGLNIQGITTGNASNGGQSSGGGGGAIPSYVWIVGLAIFGLVALKMVQR